MSEDDRAGTDGFIDRLGALDRVLDGLPGIDGHPGAVEGLAEDLFGVVDVLDRSATLRRAFTDPTTSRSARVQLAERLFGGKVGEPALELLRQALDVRWTSGRRLADGLERQAVRAELSTAAAGGGLDAVEDELFRFSRVIESSPELSSALSDRARTLADREQLVEQLLGDKVGPSTQRLARRAVRARVRSCAITLAGYVELAAELRRRTVATVSVARALDPEQLERLRAALGHQLGRDVSIQQILDPDVLGGVRVQVGDEVIEGTVAGRLAEARRRLGGT